MLLAAVARTSHRQGIRHHMSHGGADLLSVAPTPTGPREPLQLGLDAARASQNILRLLESLHGSRCAADTLATVWHPRGLLWSRQQQDDRWEALPPLDQVSPVWSLNSSAPSLLSLSLSDDRTALAKIQGADGYQRYISMLRLDPDSSRSPFTPNDGWHILCEVISGPPTSNSAHCCGEAIASVTAVLEDYLSIEHGGGEQDRKRAQALFFKQAPLLTVGTSELPHATDWSSPSGTLLCIDLETYLTGVAEQTPHAVESKRFDAIVQIDVLPCQTAAAATVHVGNGAQSLVFVDHLLLGRLDRRDNWKILSKTFAPTKWPQIPS